MIKNNLKDIPTVESLPLMIACDDGQHSSLISECPRCEEYKINRVNYQLQEEADKLKKNNG